MNNDNLDCIEKPDGFDPLDVEQWIRGLVASDPSVPEGARNAAFIVLNSLYHEDAFVRDAAGLPRDDTCREWVCWLPQVGRVSECELGQHGALMVHPEIALAAEEDRTFALLLQGRAYAATSANKTVTP